MPRVPDPRRDLSKPIERLVFRVAREEAGRRLDRFLAGHVTWRSRTGIQRLLAEGSVLLSAPGDEAETRIDRGALRMREGHRVVVLARPHARSLPRSEPSAGPLEVLLEDEWLLAVNKPAGMPAHPAGRHSHATLIAILHRKYRSAEPEHDVVPRLCHRLDRETSGVTLVSKSEDVRHLLGRQFEDREIEKEYLAVVEGRVEQDDGSIDLAIDRARDSSVRVKMAPRAHGGQHALTHFRVVERLDGATLVLCRPRTGRQHQIRVHLAAIGHPIVGDKIYGPDERYFLDALAGSLTDEARRRLVLDRHALHAHRLAFTHPRTGERVRVEAPMPDDLRTFVEARRSPSVASR